MLKCEGHKMFRGTIVCQNKSGKEFSYTGVWLYQPDIGYWYLAPNEQEPWGTSVDNAWVVRIIEEKDELVEELKAKVDILRSMVITEDNVEEAKEIWERIKELVEVR